MTASSFVPSQKDMKRDAKLAKKNEKRAKKGKPPILPNPPKLDRPEDLFMK